MEDSDKHSLDQYQTKAKKKIRCMPKLKIVESHAQPEQNNPSNLDSTSSGNSSFIGKKQLDAHTNGSVQSATSVSSIPI